MLSWLTRDFNNPTRQILTIYMYYLEKLCCLAQLLITKASIHQLLTEDYFFFFIMQKILLINTEVLLKRVK